MQLPDGRTLTKSSDVIRRGVDGNGWEINEPGPVRYYLDGAEVTEAEAEALLAQAEQP